MLRLDISLSPMVKKSITDMVNGQHNTHIMLGKKKPPGPFLLSGWAKSADKPASWDCIDVASLKIPVPAGAGNYYFMAEISGESCSSRQPVAINVTANNHSIDKWIVDSPSIHDKLIVIPGDLVTEDAICISFEQHIESGPPQTTQSSPASIDFHSIFMDITLEAYLEELQTGFDWVCGVRDELLDTVKRALFFINTLPSGHEKLKQLLSGILENPYVQTRHQSNLNFSHKYFSKALKTLKQGKIHYEIRKWLQSLNALRDTVIDAGNYAAKQPGFKHTDPNEIKTITSTMFDYGSSVSLLREKNEYLNNLEILLQKDAITSIPSTLYLDITNACNFRCKMCYQSKSHFLQTNLSNNHMLKVIESMPFLSNITVAGLGEPLLSKNIEPFTIRAKTLHCTTHLITNGSLIPGNIDALKNFSKVSISFDAANAQTFETIRHRSNFIKLKNNIMLLRTEAPLLTLCFSVVLSRLNIDELSEIFRLGAALGVNEISITPIEHMPHLELKISDKQLFDKEFEVAQKIAQKNNMRINNNVVEKSFSSTNDTARDKKQLLASIQEMPVRNKRSSNIEEITDKLFALPFQYYPHQKVFLNHQWPKPEISKKDLRHEKEEPENIKLNLADELKRLDEVINQLEKELRDKPLNFFKIPYCLDPWKLSYVKSNGDYRLCCHTDTVTGSLERDESINSSKYKMIRRSMFIFDDMLPECKKCKAADRFIGLLGLQDQCKKLQINIPAKKIM